MNDTQLIKELQETIEKLKKEINDKEKIIAELTQQLELNEEQKKSWHVMKLRSNFVSGDRLL